MVPKVTLLRFSSLEAVTVEHIGSRMNESGSRQTGGVMNTTQWWVGGKGQSSLGIPTYLEAELFCPSKFKASVVRPHYPMVSRRKGNRSPGIPFDNPDLFQSGLGQVASTLARSNWSLLAQQFPPWLFRRKRCVSSQQNCSGYGCHDCAGTSCGAFTLSYLAGSSDNYERQKACSCWTRHRMIRDPSLADVGDHESEYYYQGDCYGAPNDSYNGV